MTKYFVTPEGRYIGGFDGAEPPESAIEVPVPPRSADDVWSGDEWVPPQPPVVTQFDLDKARYAKRAAAKDGLLAYMAADNMSRVRSGEWTVPQLTSLMSDPALAAANAYMSTLSFELAAQAINSAQTPLLTPAIKADWVARLQAAFFLVP